MTPQQRAEKISAYFEMNYPVGPRNWYSECLPYLAAQIEEAEREAKKVSIQEAVDLYMEKTGKYLIEKSKAEAYEDAAKIAENIPTNTEQEWNGVRKAMNAIRQRAKELK